ncbi:hypothetical protein [Nocardioides ochotonae]|uniref:hypothetical protein n=1 Tax=Nocardioides ochotonae TaxID=2685869 RepID=UPI0017488739|nr:hypothetical protein [Nocardioides ochotonae]
MARQSSTTTVNGTARARRALAQVVWTICALLALVLALGALLVAIDATNESNELVRFVLQLADVVDLGVFSRDDGVMQFDSDTKDALLNWGLAAVSWLVIGRVLERIIRP